MEKRGDYHIHTSLCGHASGAIDAYAESALKLGLAEIGFADHLPLGPDLAHGHTMQPRELDIYVREVLRLRDAYPRMGILLGGEIGLYPGFEDDLDTLIKSYPFDYIIGSVHYFADCFVFSDVMPQLTAREREHRTAAYFELYSGGISSGLIDVLGHIDALKTLFPFDDAFVQEKMEHLLVQAAEAGLHIELNTSGLRKTVGSAYPSERILKAAAEKKIPLCLGSDAHRPGQVGYAFQQAADMLKRQGYYACPRRSGERLLFRPVRPAPGAGAE